MDNINEPDVREIRNNAILSRISQEQTFLEIGPMFVPILTKQEYNVRYTDYTTSVELRRKHRHQDYANDIVDIDFIWRPGKMLRKCIPSTYNFDGIIASHVIEHVPNPIDWINQLLDCLNPNVKGGIIILVIPKKDFCYDKYRQNTRLPLLIDAYVRNASIPSPHQMFDFFSEHCTVSNLDVNEKYLSISDSLKMTASYFSRNEYADVHCSVFTPQSFDEIIISLNNLGILNVKSTLIHENKLEFVVELKKTGEAVFFRKAKKEGITLKLILRRVLRNFRII